MSRADLTSKGKRRRDVGGQVSEVCKRFEQLICPLVPRASSKACLVERFREFVSNRPTSFQLLPIKDLSEEKPSATSWLCGVISYESKDWGILRLRDASLGTDGPGIVCVVAESGLTGCTLTCGAVNVLLVGRWTCQPFYRSKTSCPPVLNTPECSMVSCKDGTLRPSSAWPIWVRLDTLREEKEAYLEVAEYVVISAKSTVTPQSSSPVPFELKGFEEAPGDSLSLSSFEGVVSAVSPVIPSNTKHALVEIEVTHSNNHIAYLVLRENASLLLQPFLFVGKRYKFSGLKTEMATFSGEEKVIFVCSGEASVELVYAGVGPNHGCQAERTNETMEDSSELVTYEGILSARVSETTFQLDNEPQLKLIMTHWPCSSGGRGLRIGALVRASNLLPLYREGRIEGLAMSFRSQLTVVSFAGTSYSKCIRVPNHVKTKTRMLGRKHSLAAVWWFLDMLSRLHLQRYKLINQKQEELLAKILPRPPRQQRNFHTEFLRPLSFESQTKLSFEDAPLVLSVGELLLVAKSYWEKKSVSDEDVQLNKIDLNSAVGTHNFQVLASVRTHVKDGVLVLQDSTGYIEAHIEREDVAFFATLENTALYAVIDFELYVESLGTPADCSAVGRQELIVRPNCFTCDPEGWSLNRVWIGLKKENVKSNPIRILKPLPLLDNTGDVQLLLLEKGPVTSTFNVTSGEVEYSSKLRVMLVGGSCQDVHVRKSSFPMDFWKLQVLRWYKVHSATQEWSSETRIEAIPTPVSATCVLPDSSKPPSLLGITDILVDSDETAGEDGCIESRKARMSTSCSFSAVIEKVELRLQSKHGLRFMDSKNRQLHASGRKYPKVEEQCVLFVRAQDLNCPKAVDMYVSLNNITHPPGLCSEGAVINVWEALLVRTARGGVFMSCEDKTRIVVSSLEGGEDVNTSVPDTISLLVDFMRLGYVTSGYIEAFVVRLTYAVAEIQCRRCRQRFNGRSCGNMSCTSSSKLCYLKLVAIVDDGSAQAQIAFEGDRAFALIGNHKRTALERVLSSAGGVGKAEYRPGNGSFKSKSLESLLSLPESTRSPVVFVEREARGRKQKGEKDADSSEDEDTIPVQVGDTYVQTIKPLQICLRALKVCSSEISYSRTLRSLRKVE